MWVRQPCRSGSRESRETAASMPASLRGAPLGVPGGAGGQDDDPARLLRRGEVGRRAFRDQPLQRGRLHVLGVGPGQDVLDVGAGLEERGELLVVDDDGRRLALEHVGQLRAGEGGVEVDDVGAELGGRDAGVDEAAVVAAHDGHAVARADAVLAQRVGERVAALVHLEEGELAELVDEAHLVRRPQRQRGEPARRAGPPLQQRLAHLEQHRRRVGPDDAGPAEDGDLGGVLPREGGGLACDGQEGTSSLRTRNGHVTVTTGYRKRSGVRPAISAGSWGRRAAWPSSPC